MPALLRHRLALVAIAAALILVGGLAVLLVQSQRGSRRDLEERFGLRASIAARFVHTWTRQLLEQERAQALEHLAGEEIRAADFEELVRDFDFPAALWIDHGGRALAVWPRSPETIGRDMTTYAHVHNALMQGDAVSVVVPSASERIPVVALAVRYDSSSGPRVFSGAYEAARTPLQPFVQSIVSIPGTRAYLLDSQGILFATSGRPPERIMRLSEVDPALAASIHRTTGTYRRRDGDHYFTIADVRGTPWRLVASVPSAEMFQPLRGAWLVPWIALGGFGLVAAVAVGLALALIRDRDRLASANDTLARSLSERERLNEALDEFAGHVAHDLRNPLGRMKLWTDTMDRPEAAHLRTQAVTSIRAAASEAIQLVEDLLTLARASGSVDPKPIVLSEIVSRAARDLADNVDVSVTRDGRLLADPGSLQHALHNLFENASRYASGGARAAVDVWVQSSGDGWVLAVADRGPGLPQGEERELFRPFTRGVDSGRGTGLGLSIVARCASAHGGRAWYEPREGGGAVFRMFLRTPAPASVE